MSLGKFQRYSSSMLVISVVAVDYNPLCCAQIAGRLERLDVSELSSCHGGVA